MPDLTKIALDRLEPGPARREIPDGKVAGLYHVIQPSGARSWALRYRRDGKPIKFTIGPYPAVSLADARKRANEAWVMINRGEEPGAAKKAAREAAQAVRNPAAIETIEGIVERFLERHVRPNTKPRSSAETERILRREVIAAWPGRRLADIKRKDVHALLDAIVDRGAPIMANRTLAALRKLCAWAVERDIIDSSPCDKIRPPAKEVSRDRVLTDDELRRAWAAFDTIGQPFGALFKLLALTGQREAEVANMRWTELDLNGAVWTIPKERAKNGVGHVVPLSAPALEILRAIPVVGAAGWVFTTTGATAVSGFSNAKERVDALAGNIDVEGGAAHWTAHDLRRTWVTGCARLGIAPHIVDAAINHVSGAIRGVAAVYNRHEYLDDRRAAMDAWGAYISNLCK